MAATTEASVTAISREDLQRAEAILRSIVADLEEPQEVDQVLMEEERESLGALQGMLDIVQSPLFAAVVDITEKCKKTIVESEVWNEAADVKATTEDVVVAQFKERYRIPSVSGGSSGTPDTLLDDTAIVSPSNDPDPLISGANHHSSASLALNREHQRTPSLSSCDSVSSAGSRRKRGKKTGKGLTLVHLAREPALPHECGDSIPLKTLPGQHPGPPRVAHQEMNRDVSLSSLSCETSPPPLPPSLPPSCENSPPPLPPSLPPSCENSPPPLPPSLPPSCETSPPPLPPSLPPSCKNSPPPLPPSLPPSCETSPPPLPPSLPPSCENSPPPLPPSLPPMLSTTPPSSPLTSSGNQGERKEGVETKDLLFFMRDEESMKDVRATLNGRWGRDPREVQLHSSPTSIELCGLSSTGVYISSVPSGTLEDRLQEGDQLLEVNGQSIKNMAWFEVKQLIDKSLTGGQLPRQHTSGGGGSQTELQQEEKGVEEERNGRMWCTLVVQYNPAGLGEVKRVKTETS